MTGKQFFRICFLLTLLLICLLVGVPAIAQDDAEAQIESAMSAAPPAIAENATIMGSSADGELVILREGTNGWTCFPDYAGSPGPDPICMDEVFMLWNDALVAGTDFETDVPGLAYMLQGGSDASNTDPFALEPAEGEDWISTPPHVMLLLPGGLDPALFSTDHDSGEPYIMWAGTPYEHIMMPVNLEAMAH